MFERLETSLGINFIPDGMLLSPKVRPYFLPITTLMYDWMHVYVASGIFQIQLSRLLHILRREVPHYAFHNELQQWNWPAKHRGVSGIDTFKKKKRGEEGKIPKVTCSASEALCLFPVLRHFLKHKMVGDPAARLAIQCFCLLCDVLSLLMRTSGRSKVDPKELHNAIAEHLKVYQSVAIDDWVPKCHWVLHLPEQLQRHKCLLTCFVTERKHKEVKRTANELDNTFAGFERKILLDTVHAHVVALKGELNVPVIRPRLENPQLAPPELARAVQEAAACDEEVTCSDTVVCPPLQKYSRGDVVLSKDSNGVPSVSKVVGHVCIVDVCMSICQKWKPRGNDVFEIKDANSEFILIHIVNLEDFISYRFVKVRTMASLAQRF